MTTRRTATAFPALTALALLAVAGWAPRLAHAGARDILDAAGFKGGVIVHLGCGDGRLTAAFGVEGQYVVHGLDADPDRIAQARAHIRSKGLYGRVAVEHWAGNRLPYASNMVNLLVAQDLGSVPVSEALRVLCPNGVACIKSWGKGAKLEVPAAARSALAGLGITGARVSAGGETWATFRKPPADGVDEWTHYLHDASGNPVAHDRVVGPPRRMQWVEGPRHARSHEYTPSTFALVSTGGRIFYVADLGSTAALRQPAQWHIVARDAYNGALLWQRLIPTWFSHLCGWTSGPLQLQRKLVAVGGRVYVTLGFHAALSALDAATGEVLKVYEHTRGTEEVLWHKGILLLLVRSVTEARVAELSKWAELEKKDKSPLYERESARPLVKRFRSTENKAARSIVALDADTGRVLWQKTGAEARLRPLSLCACGDRVFYQQGGNTVCLDLKTGEKRWSAAAGRLRVVCDRAAICSTRQAVTALSAETGKAMWTQRPLLCSIRDAFVISGSVWLGGFKPYDTGRKHTGPAWGPYFATQRDLATGEVLKHVEPENPKHHHRCWQNKATDRYILGGRRGVEFIDLDTGDVLWHSWVRGVCRYGVMPCNGLLYAPPHACGCYVAAKLTGFYALAPAEGNGPAVNRPAQARPERGPAYGAVESRQSRTENKENWPTLRGNAERSGATPAAVPVVLRQRWQAKVGEKLSSLTVADGKVCVASVDQHEVCAVDADSGEAAWRFTAGARVDSPPTLYKGRAIFGCRDGYVYSLRASDGVLDWRLCVAPRDRRVLAYGQIESVSPAHGSVMIQEGVAYLAAGRSSYLDGGIGLYRIQPENGKTLSRTPVYSPDPDTGRQPAQSGPCNMPGALEEILTTDGEYVYLRDMVFDKSGKAQAKGNPHLLALTGFLDATWPHRSYWAFGTRCAMSTGCSGRPRNLIYGRLLVADGPMIYGYGRGQVHWSNALQDGPYRLFARKQGERKEHWAQPVQATIRAMVLADKVLFAAGPARGARKGDPDALLLALSAADGSELARYPLESPPVLDGMAAANGRLYLATEDGRLLCMGKD